MFSWHLYVGRLHAQVEMITVTRCSSFQIFPSFFSSCKFFINQDRSLEKLATGTHTPNSQESRATHSTPMFVGWFSFPSSHSVPFLLQLFKRIIILLLLRVPTLQGCIHRSGNAWNNNHPFHPRCKLSGANRVYINQIVCVPLMRLWQENYCNCDEGSVCVGWVSLCMMQRYFNKLRPATVI